MPAATWLLTASLAAAGRPPAAGRPFTEHEIAVAGTTLHCRDYPGAEPAFVLLHGFPDHQGLYDALVPQLRGRRVVTFDFVGWSRSGRPANYPYGATQQKAELAAVVDHLRLGPFVLVAHDMAGPPAIDYGLEQPTKVSRLVLLNTYYHPTAARRTPEALWLFSTPVVRWFTVPVARFNPVFRLVYNWQVGGFFVSKQHRRHYLPLFRQQFTEVSAAKRAFFRTVRQVRGTLARNAGQLERLRTFQPPVLVAFGADDRYLGAALAQEFSALFPHSQLQLIKGARHYPQIDAAEQVAALLLAQ